MLDYVRLLSALKSGTTAQLQSLFLHMTASELVEAGTFIGPDRLRKVILIHSHMVPHGGVASARHLPEQAQRPARDGATADNQQTNMLLIEVMRQAFGSSLGPAASPELYRQVAALLAAVERRRTVAPLVTMSEDVTRTLPKPTSVPPPLSTQDYVASAQRNAVEVAAIKAVATVESGGRSGFDSQGRPVILFEAHHFGPLTGNRFIKTHPHLAKKARDTKGSARYYRWDQYERLREAMVLDVDAALRATSWGKFQVLGENHDGWSNIRDFVKAMYVSEANHLRAFEVHCASGGLMAALRRKDWFAFALYNGKGHQRAYGDLIATAYRANGGGNSGHPVRRGRG